MALSASLYASTCLPASLPLVLVLALIDLGTIRVVDAATAAAIRPRGNRSRATASGADAVRATGVVVVAHRANHTAISAIAASITRLSSTASASAAASFGAQKLAQA